MKIFKYLKKRDMLMVVFCIGLVVLQVWLELTMPDYTKKLTEAVSAQRADMDTVYENGGKMLLCAVGSMI